MHSETTKQGETITVNEYDDCLKLKLEEPDGSEAITHLSEAEADRLGYALLMWVNRKHPMNDQVSKQPMNKPWR